MALSYFTDRIQPLLAPYAAMPKHYKADDSDTEEIISAEVDVSDTKTLSIKMLALMAKDVCAGPAVWKRRWGHDKEAMAELEGRPEYCLDLTFMHGLLGLGEYRWVHRHASEKGRSSSNSFVARLRTV